MAFQAQNAVIGGVLHFPAILEGQLFVFLGPLGGKPRFVAWPIVCFSELAPCALSAKFIFIRMGFA